MARHFMMKFASLLLVSLVVCSVVGQEEGVCSVTGNEPGLPPAAIRFCSMFQTLSCCDPAIDSEIQGYYNDMIGVSELCASVTTLSHIHLRYLYCYACSPREPRSTDVDANTIYICPEFSKKLDPGAYDNCGLAIPGERGNICAGDDIVMPSMHYASDDPDADQARGRTLNFLNDPNGATPPYFEGYQVEICDESDEECMARCFDMSAASSLLTRNGQLGGGVVLLLGTLLLLTVQEVIV